MLIYIAVLDYDIVRSLCCMITNNNKYYIVLESINIANKHIGQLHAYETGIVVNLPLCSSQPHSEQQCHQCIRIMFYRHLVRY
jgi:hypothetical protein